MNLSIAELKKALNIRIKKASAIRTKIAKLEANIARLKKQLDEIMGGKTVKPKAVQQKRRQYRKIKEKVWPKIKTVKNEGGTLKEALIKVLAQAGKPLHINDILQGLKDVGYKSGAKDLKRIAGVRLYTDKEFIKTAPGTFTLKAIVAKAPVKKSVKVKSKKTK